LLVDTHVHLDDGKYRADFEDLLARSRQAGVGTLVSIGTGLEDSAWATETAAKQEGCYASVGLHPQFAASWKEGDEERFQALAQRPKVVAIGECGLDYHHPDPAKEAQFPVFRAMCRIAARLKLPLVIHQREAAEDTLRILEEEGGGREGGVFHCFAGDLDTARRAMGLGFFLAVGGILTFPNAGALREVIRQVPLERLVLETDGPWLAPQGRRGQRNEPAYLPEIAAKLAEVKGADIEEVGRVTTENARKLFRI
jgi:TatD DNase family protein